MKSGSVILCMLALAVCGIGPTMAEDPALRRQHLPYVRAASDCIATAVRNDFWFTVAVEQNSFTAPIMRAKSSCWSQIQAMIVAHDRLYGTGGREFYEGPYELDLERAVRTRLKEVIVRTAETSARARAEKQAQEERLRQEAAEKAARDAEERKVRDEQQRQEAAAKAAKDAEERRQAEARAADERAAAAARARAERLEAENRERAAREAKLAMLRPAQSLLREKAFGCINQETQAMLKGAESAEAVAKAGMLLCRSEVEALTRVTGEVLETESGESILLNALRPMAEKSVADLVAAEVMRRRGSAR